MLEELKPFVVYFNKLSFI